MSDMMHAHAVLRDPWPKVRMASTRLFAGGVAGPWVVARTIALCIEEVLGGDNRVDLIIEPLSLRIPMKFLSFFGRPMNTKQGEKRTEDRRREY